MPTAGNRRARILSILIVFGCCLVLAGCNRVDYVEGNGKPRFPVPVLPTNVSALPELPALANTPSWDEFKSGIQAAIDYGTKSGVVTDHARLDAIVKALSKGNHDDPAVKVVMKYVLLLATNEAQSLPPIAPSSDAAGAGTLSWKPCEADGLQCASLKVPLDYTKPSGASVDIKMDRYPARKPDQRIGVLMANPGGPGGSGLDFLPAWYSGLSDELKDHFDIVSFDPRGVGQSDPFVCGKPKSPGDTSPNPKTPAEEAAYTALAKSYGDACDTIDPQMLQNIGTKNVARDMDEMRKAMGEDKITYLGYSYGTEIGQVYANLFPDQVRAFVLDGVVDPGLTKQQLSTAQTAAFDNALSRFAKSCPKVCTGLGQYVVQQSGNKQIDSKYLGSSDYVDPNYADTAISAMLYSKSRWPLLAWALREAAVDKDGTLLALAVDSYSGRSIFTGESSSNGDDSFIAIMCRDFAISSLPDAYRMSRTSNRLHPIFASNPDVLCNEWPSQPDVIGPVTWPKSVPVLLVSTTGDPATPHKLAQNVAARNPSAVLLTHDGDGHTAYSSGDNCIDAKVNQFLIDVKAPKKGTVCG